MTEDELMRKYYELDEKLKAVAERVVLNVFQSWGQTKEEMNEALLEAVKMAGFKGIVIDQGQFLVPISEQERVSLFMEELEKCWPLGHVEWEVAAVASVIEKFRDGK